MAKPTLFTEYLRLLNVPHTRDYSSKRFLAYPSKLSVTAMSDLLNEYNVTHDVRTVSDKSDYCSIDVPFVAQFQNNSCIVTGADKDGVRVIDWQLHERTIPKDQFISRWTGKILTSSDADNGCEPDYKKHLLEQDVSTVVNVGLKLCVAFFIVFFFIKNELYKEVGTILLTVFYCCGLYVSYLLLLKSAHVQSHAADNMCRVIQREGCNTVLEHKGAKLFGILGWSEIGLTYFSVSLTALLLSPECLHYLAWINVCCLPFSFWSVSYQKFVIHAWCTLCLCIQALFWLLFASFLIGGYFHSLLPVPWQAVVLAVGYLTVLLAAHGFTPILYKYEQEELE